MIAAASANRGLVDPCARRGGDHRARRSSLGGQDILRQGENHGAGPSAASQRNARSMYSARRSVRSTSATHFTSGPKSAR
jgi:hypothetical protein